MNVTILFVHIITGLELQGDYKKGETPNDIKALLSKKRHMSKMPEGHDSYTLMYNHVLSNRGHYTRKYKKEWNECLKAVEKEGKKKEKKESKISEV